MVLRLSPLMLLGVRVRASRPAPAGHEIGTSPASRISRASKPPSPAAARRSPKACPRSRRLGFKSIINLRLPTEAGANVEAEAAAAKAAGINFYSIPFSGQSPDPAVADKFLETLTTPGNEPAYIHCAAGNRAAAMWMIKRLAVDHWDTDRAFHEATRARTDEPGPEAVRHRLRAIAQAVDEPGIVRDWVRRPTP